jgi:Icc protein
MPVVALQISDIHLFNDPQQQLHEQTVEQNLLDVIAYVQQYEMPDLLLLTGDLTDNGDPLAYQRLAQHFAAFACPVFALPGNHDDVKVLKQSFADTAISTEKSFVLNGWHFVLLDSVIAGHCEGQLSADELAFLDKALSKHAALPTVIALHHHVLPINGAMDRIMLTNANDLLSVLNRHPQVHCVLAGHVHQASAIEQNNISFLTVPATSYQMKVNSAEFTDDLNVAPGYRWLALADDGRVDTLVKRI